MLEHYSAIHLEKDALDDDTLTAALRQWLESKKMTCEALREAARQESENVKPGHLGNIVLAVIDAEAMFLNYDIAGGNRAQTVIVRNNEVRFSAVAGFKPLPYFDLRTKTAEIVLRNCKVIVRKAVFS